MKYSKAIEMEIDPDVPACEKSACYVCQVFLARTTREQRGRENAFCQGCPLVQSTVEAVSGYIAGYRSTSCMVFRESFNRGSQWAVYAALSILECLKAQGD